MENELRILNGLHRGATLPLDGSTLLLGAHEDADVVMVDPGIMPHHASLQQSDSGWMLTADAGPIFSAEAAEPQALVDLWSGSFFRIGETWLVISESGAPWQTMPAMPLPQSEMDAVEASLDEFDVDASADADADASADTAIDSASNAGANDFYDALQDAEDAPHLVSDPQEVPLAQAPSANAPAATKRWRKWMSIPAGMLVALSAVAAFAYSTKPSVPSLNGSLRLSANITLPQDRSLAFLDRKESGTDIAKAALPATSSPARLSPDELRTAFRKRMKDADLLRQFDLDLTDEGWSMRAHLDDAESTRFERILKAFVAEHKISFPINAKVGSAESMLPFKIQQVVSGANAGIVTGTGERFYVGDEFQGVRLVSIVDNRLTFMGKRKIEVVW